MRKIYLDNYKGFSLIELCIVIAIIGILTAIAYPSYTNYIFKSHRSDALATLSFYQVILERCYAQNFSYVACAGLPVFPVISPQGYYSISLSNLGASTYTLTAVPVGTQAADTTCSVLTVNQANVNTATDNGGTAQPTCWSPT